MHWKLRWIKYDSFNAAHLTRHTWRQTIATTDTNGNAAAKIRKSKCCAPITTKLCTNQRKECSVLANWQKLTFCACPTTWTKVPHELHHFSDERIGASIGLACINI